MKNLKLMLFPLLLVGFLLVSCKDDDDSSSDNVDILVGQWKISDVLLDGVSVYDQLVIFAPCPIQNKFHFQNDYTLSIETFEEDSASESCVAGATQTGTWSKTNDEYTVTFDDTGETNSSTVDFQDNNTFTTMTTFEGQEVLLELSRQ